MKHVVATSSLFFLLAIRATLAVQSSCVQCHLSTDWVSDTSLAATFVTDDIHNLAGLGCESCHGGDPKRGFKEGDPSLAMDPAKGYKPPPGDLEIPAFCGVCHSNIEYMKQYDPTLPTDQFTLYRTSIHGKRLYGQKDTKVAVCTDCHGTHLILPASDSRSPVYHNNIPFTCHSCHSDKVYMRGYNIPTSQFENYANSVHGKLVLEKGDKSAPACNDCHGNHGATLPNLASVSAACGHCHANNQEFFNESPHKEPWSELGLPECEQCHGNHLILPTTDEMVGISPGALCVECHDEASGGYAAADSISHLLDSLKIALNVTDSLISKAKNLGVESGQASFDLGPTKDALIRARSEVHTFTPGRVADVVKPGIETSLAIQQRVVASLKDVKVRQIGLGMSSVLIILLIVALWLKIKQADRKIGL